MREAPATADLLAAQRDVQAKLGDRPLDSESMHAVANIYRAAAAVRRLAERTILAEANVSWGGFTILWVLWVWGEMETAQLAAECDLTKGTLTGMVTTLEKEGIVTRERLQHDRRRVRVALTDKGEALIEDLFPRFNNFETTMTNGLTDDEKRLLAGLLGRIATNANESD
jgi:DNA-binding MarR family transcriptional regulator